MGAHDEILQDLELLALDMKPRTVEEWRCFALRLRQEWGGIRVYASEPPEPPKAAKGR